MASRRMEVDHVCMASRKNWAMLGIARRLGREQKLQIRTLVRNAPLILV